MRGCRDSQSGLWISEWTVPFLRDPDNSAFELLTPGERGGLRVLLSTAHVRICGSKGTKGDCPIVLGLHAQGQENYGGKERA